MAEDAPATAVDVLANDTDPDGGLKMIGSASDPANGTVVITVGGAGLTYQPDPNYCNAPPGTTPDTFTYTLNGGSTATVSITVTCVDDPPTAVNDSATVLEDAAATAIDVLANDTDTDGGPMTIASASDPANGTVVLTGGSPGAHTGLTYQPDPNYCNDPPGTSPDTFTYTLNGGSTATVSVTVTCVNDAPTAVDDSYSTDEDAPLNVNAAGGVLTNDTDVEDDTLTAVLASGPAHAASFVLNANGSFDYTPAPNFHGTDTFTYTASDGTALSNVATVTITVNPLSDLPVAVDDAYDADATGAASATAPGVLGNDIDVDGDSLTAVLVSGPTDAASFTLNADGSFSYQATAGASGSDSFTYKANDGSADSNVATVTITLNTPPVAQNVSVADAQEDTAKSITLTATDADGDALTFTATDPANGSLDDLTPTATCGVVLNTCTASVTYTPDADFNGTDSFTYTANDGLIDSNQATVSITIAASNDAPVLANIEAGALAYTENDPATVVTATTTVNDVDSANFDTGTLTVDYSVGGTPDDRLEIRNEGTGPGQIGVSGSNVTFGGTTIGTFTGGSGTTPLVVTLNANATPAAVQALVRNVTFRNVSDSPSTAARTTRFVLTDGDGGTSAPATRAIAVTAVNDAPVLAGIEAGALAYAENAAATAITSTLTAADLDSATLAGATVQITGNYQNGQDVLALPAQPNHHGQLHCRHRHADAHGHSHCRRVPDGVARGHVREHERQPVDACAHRELPGQRRRGPQQPQQHGHAHDHRHGRQRRAGAGQRRRQLVGVHGERGGDGDHLHVDGHGRRQREPHWRDRPDHRQLPERAGRAGAPGPAEYHGQLQRRHRHADAHGHGHCRRVPDGVARGHVREHERQPVDACAHRELSGRTTAPALNNLSNIATRTIAVTAVNDAPVVNLDAAGALTYTEQAGFVNLFGPAATVTDVDSATLESLTVTINSGFDAAFDTLELNTAGFVANFAAGTLTITRAGGTPADFTTALRNVRFRNTDDDPDDRNDGTANPSVADRTVQAVADDGPDTSSPQSRNLTITPVNDAPGAASPLPSTSSVRNTTLVSGTNSVTHPKVTRTIDFKAGSVDPDGLESAITVVPVSAVATTNAGRITLTAAGDLRLRAAVQHQPGQRHVRLPADGWHDRELCDHLHRQSRRRPDLRRRPVAGARRRHRRAAVRHARRRDRRHRPATRSTSGAHPATARSPPASRSLAATSCSARASRSSAPRSAPRPVTRCSRPARSRY